LTVTIAADGVAAAPIERFRSMTPEEYFEQYLAAPLAPAAATAAPDAAADAVDPAAASTQPPGTPQ
jgi:hypothetical protein